MNNKKLIIVVVSIAAYIALVFAQTGLIHAGVPRLIAYTLGLIGGAVIGFCSFRFWPKGEQE